MSKEIETEDRCLHLRGAATYPAGSVTASRFNRVEGARDYPNQAAKTRGFDPIQNE